MFLLAVALVVAQPPERVEYYPMTRLEDSRRPLLRLTIEIGGRSRSCYAQPAPRYQYASPAPRQYYQPAPRYMPQADRTRFENCGPSGRLQFQRCSPSPLSYPGAYGNAYGCPSGGCPTSR
jgi:hypothetical protein